MIAYKDGDEPVTVDGQDGEPQWKARSSQGGLMFCAPRCGAGCSREQFDEALATARKMRRSLGVHWEAYVFENMRWYAGCRLILKGVRGPTGDRPHLDVRPEFNYNKPNNPLTHYTCYANLSHQYIVNGASAQGVVRDALKLANADAARLCGQITEAQSLAGTVT